MATATSWRSFRSRGTIKRKCEHSSSQASPRWGTIDEELNRDLVDIATSYSHGRVVVAIREGCVVGTGTVMPRTHGTAEILRLSVPISDRRGGVGRSIVDAPIDVAGSWSAQRVICETSSNWTSAVEFYLRCDFQVDREEDDFGRDTHFWKEIAGASRGRDRSDHAEHDTRF